MGELRCNNSTTGAPILLSFFIFEQIKNAFELKAILTANRLSALGVSDPRCGLMELA